MVGVMLLQNEGGLVGVHPVAALHVRLQTLSQFELLRTTRAFEVSDRYVNDAVVSVEVGLVREVPPAEHTRELFDQLVFRRLHFLFVESVCRRGRYRRGLEELLVLLSEKSGVVWVRDDGDQSAGGRVDERRSVGRVRGWQRQGFVGVGEGEVGQVGVVTVEARGEAAGAMVFGQMRTEEHVGREFFHGRI